MFALLPNVCKPMQIHNDLNPSPSSDSSAKAFLEPRCCGYSGELLVLFLNLGKEFLEGWKIIGVIGCFRSHLLKWFSFTSVSYTTVLCLWGKNSK